MVNNIYKLLFIVLISFVLSSNSFLESTNDDKIIIGISSYKRGVNNFDYYHFSKDTTSKAKFKETDDIKYLRSDNYAVEESKPIEIKIEVTKDEDNKILVNGKYVLVLRENLSAEEYYKNIAYKYISGGYLLESIPNDISVIDKSLAIIKGSSDVLNKKLINKDDKPVYVFTGDYRLYSSYKTSFTLVDPIEVPYGSYLFSDKDFAQNLAEINIPVGENIDNQQVSVTKADDKYICSYNGLPLYSSKDGSDLQGKEANGGKYFEIFLNGTIRGESSNIEPYSAEFDKLFTGTSSMIKYGMSLLILLFLMI